MKERRFVTGKDAQELLHFYRSAVRTRSYSDEAVSSKCSRKTAKICYTGRTEMEVHVCACDKSSGHRAQDVNSSLAYIGFLPQSTLSEMVNHAAKSRTA